MRFRPLRGMARPHVVGTLAHDPHTLVISLPPSLADQSKGRGLRRGGTTYLRLSELRDAAQQADPEGRDIYAGLLAEAEAAMRMRRHED